MKNKKMFVMFVVSLFLLSGIVYAYDTKTNTKNPGNAGPSCKGEFNSFYGFQAGYKSEECVSNTFVGMNAGYSTTTGSSNTFLGAWAGDKNTEGQGNTFLGTCSGQFSTTVQGNTFIGAWAGCNNISSGFNTFVGYNAGKLSTGKGNTFLGYEAGYEIEYEDPTKKEKLEFTGTNNTFLGCHAGSCNTTGENNIFVGQGAGHQNTDGKDNIFIGQRAGFSSTTGQYNTILGCQAGRYLNGSSNSFLGHLAGQNNKNGNENTFLGLGAGYDSEGSRNVFIGNKAGYNESGSDKLYIANGPNPNNVLIYGDFSEKLVGIGNTEPSCTLDVNGTIKGKSTVTPSDIRLKKDIKPIKNALDNIAHLRGITFRWKDNEGDNGRHPGVIAQEVEEIFPEVVSTDNKGYKSVDYSKLAAPLIEAVKELKAENEALKARIEALERRSATGR